MRALVRAIGFSRLVRGWPSKRRALSHPGRNLIAAGAVMLLVMLAAAAAMVLDRRAADIAATEHETDALSTALTEQTSLTFEGADFVLHNLLERIAAAAVTSPETLAPNMATPDVQRMLRDQVAGLTQVDVAGIIDASGRLINTSARWPVPDVYLGDRDFFRALRDDPALQYFIGMPVLSRTTARQAMSLARRISAPDGRFLGIVLGSVTLDYFSNLYRAVSEGEGRFVALQRTDGARLVRYPPFDRGPDVIPADDATVADTQAGAGVSRTLARSPVTGQMVLRVARALKDYPLVLVVGRTEDSILANWRRQTVAIGFGVGLAAAAFIAGLILLAGQIARRAASEATLAATLDHIDQGIIMIDADSRVQVYNRRASEMLDFPPDMLAANPHLEDLVRLQWDSSEFGPGGENVDDAIRAFILAGGVSHERHTYERRRPGGSVIEVTSIPLADGGLVRTYSDVTAARTREAALEAALAARDAAEQALRQHAGDLERELAERTRPLAASEARHRDITEVSSDWIWEIDTEQTVTFLSKRFGETSGIPWSKVSGRPLADLVGLGFDPAAMDQLRAAVDARGVFHDVTYRVELAGGEVRYWLLSGKPFTDPATGAYAGYRGTGTDVTVKIAREAALNAALLRAEAAEREARQATSRLMEAIEAIPEGFVLHDAEDRLVLCNTRYAEFYQLSPAARTPGAAFADTVREKAVRANPGRTPQDIENMVVERMARHRSAPGNREEQRLANGRWLQVSERRTSDLGTVGIQVDVTEARQREVAERDREKLAALGHLAGGVAHEINNLLQPALALSDLVRDSVPPDDADSHEALDCVLDSTRKIRDIVRNILLFARKEEPRLTPLDLVAEVRAALGFVTQLMPPSVAIREQDLDAHAGVTVAANKTQLTQVLTNLLVNAGQAITGTGTITVSVAPCDPTPEEAAERAIDQGRPYLAISIADTGSGMDAATQARIFEPFFTTKPVGQGTGLGLSVVYGILRGWKGAITVRSALGQGTTFVLYVPVLM